MTALWVRALGPLDVVVDGSPVVVGAGKPRIVLGCLLLRANSVVNSDVLVEAVWGGDAPATPGPQLQVYVANLRRLLDPDRSKGAPSQRLASRSGGYLLSLDADEFDLLRFRAMVAAGETAIQGGDLVGGSDVFRRALQLCRGPVFPDMADVALFRAELDEIEETRLRVYQDLIDVELALGRHVWLVGELQSLVAEQPYRERLWASLVVALYRSDRQVDALAACRDARRRFVEDLGIDPSARLSRLEELVLRHDASLDAPPTDGHRRIRHRVDNLPAALTPLVGRDTEVAELTALLVADDIRLVTVTGPGGTGKTRLALATASQLRARRPDGVCWVDLAPLTESGQVAMAIAAVLGLTESAADPLTALTHFLRPRRLLLVLDNFEHLEPAWPIVVDLLTTASDLQILTTSRRPLGLRAEYQYELTPLAVPPFDPRLPPEALQDVPAVELLVSRGQAVRRGLTLTDDNAMIVSQICRRLDGLPLALELAAAQLRAISERVLLDDLEVSFAALTSTFRDLPDRQRTLAATITWSLQLLTAEAQDFFDQLGVFTADPTTEAVSRICGDTRGASAHIDDVLGGLADHSLLRRYTDPSGTTRVAMLQTIREFARDRLGRRGDATEVRRRHAEFYLTRAETLGPLLWGQGQVEAYQRLHADALDLRAALLWAAGPDGSAELALRLVAHLWHYWELTDDVTEQCGIVLRLLADASQAPDTLVAPAFSAAATMCWMLGRHQQASDLHHQALERFRSGGNQAGVAWTTMCLAVLAVERNEPAAAERLATEALSSPHALPRTLVSASIVLSLAAFYAGDYARALEQSRTSVALARPLGDRWLLGLVLLNLADSTAQAGDYDAAEHLLLEALRTALELAAQGHLMPILESLGAVYVAQHRTEQAIRVMAAADAYRSDRGLPMNAPERTRLEPIISKARTAAGAIPFALVWTAGQALSLDQVAQQVLFPPNRASTADQQETSPRDDCAPASRDRPTTSPVNPAPWT